MKIIIVNHTFQLPRFYKRWQLLAKDHPEWDVTLIAPSKFKYDTNHSLIFGDNVQSIGADFEDGNFHIIAVPIRNTSVGWISNEMVKVIRQINPDILYHIGGHTQLSLVQCIKTVKHHMPKTKMITFSMRGPAMNIRFPQFSGIQNLPKWLLSLASYLLRKHNLKYFNTGSDAVLCHYPNAIKCFREEGYSGPIYISTQVGVDTDLFAQNQTYREEIRRKLNLGDSFVFGTAVRFTPEKGLPEIIQALPVDGNWKLLIMGTGDPVFTNSLVSMINERGIKDKVIFTGFLEWNEIAKYWNAIDCALHFTLTTAKWEETFSLSIIQAMATGKAVIGSDSGSIPYQLGPDGIIVHEGDVKALNQKIIWAINHPNEVKLIGDRLRRYAISSFSIKHLNRQFAAILDDVQKGYFSESIADMTKFNEDAQH